MTTALTTSVDHQSAIDALELAMLAQPKLLGELPVEHTFTDGLYARRIFMPAGSFLTSKIHKTEHPYVIMSGRVSVFVPGVGVQHLKAPHFGITKPGTRRVLYIHEDTVWITFHVNPDNETVEEIENRIIERRELSDGRTINEHYMELLEGNNLPEQLDYQGAP